jgi:hypothetical protein
MTSLLTRCRYMLSRHRGLRVLWALTVLGLLVATVPRWELHQHVVVDHDHDHVGLPHDHHHDLMSYSDTEGGAAVTHLHSAPAFSIALIQAVMPSLDRLSSSADAFASPESTPVASCWPPPHRPPIA